MHENILYLEQRHRGIHSAFLSERIAQVAILGPTALKPRVEVSLSLLRI